MNTFRAYCFSILCVLPVLWFASCASRAHVTAGIYISKVYFCEGKMYVSDGLLSAPVRRKIEKGIYVEFEILDSTKLNRGVQLFDVKNFEWIEGRYVRVIRIGKRPEARMTKLYLYDGVFD